MTATLSPNLSLQILNLSNQDEANVLYVEDDASAGDTLELTVTNSGSAINLFSNASANANQSTYSFYLYFQPSTVLVDMDIAIAEDGKTFVAADGTGDWKSQITKNTKDGSVSIYFLKKSTAALSNALKVKLQRLKPVVGNSRSSNVELHVRNNSSQEYFCQTYLNIINHQGQRYIPLKIDVNSSQLLNDGSGNDLKINLINTGQGPINFNDSTIEVTFDVQQPKESKSYALTSSDQIPASINIAGTKISSNVENVNPIYTLNKYATSLNTNQSLAIEIVALKTNLPPGATNISINYRNVPGYWDGTLMVPLQRGPLFQSGEKVGIGTSAPSTSLEVKTATNYGIQHTNGTVKLATYINDDSGWLGTRSNHPLNLFTSDSKNSQLIITTDGNVGIGNSNPIGPLTIGNAAKANSDGFLVIAKNNNKGSNRQFRLGFDENFNFTIGDYGNANRAGTWTSPFSINWQAPDNSLRIDANGHVGIGMANPGVSLEVKTATNKHGIQHTDGVATLGTYVGKWEGKNNAGWLGTTSNHPLKFFTDDSDAHLTIDTEGRVGIGTITPDAPLDVNGLIHCKQLKIGNTLISEDELGKLLKLVRGEIFTLYNDNYKEYLYASGSTHSGQQRYIFSWRDDTLDENRDNVINDKQAFWFIEFPKEKSS